MAKDAAALDALITKIDAAIEAILDGGAIQSHEINGRQVSRYSLQELQGLRRTYMRQLASVRGRQQNRAGFREPK